MSFFWAHHMQVSESSGIHRGSIESSLASESLTAVIDPSAGPSGSRPHSVAPLDFLLSFGLFLMSVSSRLDSKISPTNGSYQPRELRTIYNSGLELYRSDARL